MRCSLRLAALPGRAVVVLFVAVGVPALAGAAGTTGPRAEVQMNLCSEPAELIRALHLRPAGAPVEAWYFETAGRDVFDRGAVFRLRLTGSNGELTVKIANQDCSKVDRTFLRQGVGKCGYDLHGADFKGAVSLARKLDAATVQALLESRLPPAEVLAAAQMWHCAPTNRRRRATRPAISAACPDR